MHQASSHIKDTVFMPAPHQPEFQCLHCNQGCFSSAGLKNNIHAKHNSDEASASRSSPDNSDNEEEHHMDVDSDVQLPPAFQKDEYNDDGYNSEFDMNLNDHNVNIPSSESTLIIPSSPQLESRPHEHR